MSGVHDKTKGFSTRYCRVTRSIVLTKYRCSCSSNNPWTFSMTKNFDEESQRFDKNGLANYFVDRFYGACLSN